MTSTDLQETGGLDKNFVAGEGLGIEGGDLVSTGLEGDLLLRGGERKFPVRTEKRKTRKTAVTRIFWAGFCNAGKNSIGNLTPPKETHDRGVLEIVPSNIAQWPGRPACASPDK
jgi:hypothetical protein